MKGLEKVKTTIEKFATGKYLASSIVLLSFFLIRMRSDDGNYLDMRFGYSSKDAYKVINDLGIMGRSSYLSFLGIDFGIIAFFSISMLLLIAILLKKLKMNDKWTFTYLLPLVRGVFDIFENIFIMLILLKYPKRLDTIAEIGGIMTRFKWIFMIITMALIIIFAAMLLIKSIRSKKNCT